MRVKRAIFCLLVVVFMVGCTANLALKPWSEQTPKERLTWMLGIYNAQDRDYRAMAALPSLTEGQKKMMATKKAIMTQVYPLISLYGSVVEAGGIPSHETEQQILNMLNQLQMVGG